MEYLYIYIAELSKHCSDTALNPSTVKISMLPFFTLVYFLENLDSWLKPGTVLRSFKRQPKTESQIDFIYICIGLSC